MCPIFLGVFSLAMCMYYFWSYLSLLFFLVLVSSFFFFRAACDGGRGYYERMCIFLSKRYRECFCFVVVCLVFFVSSLFLPYGSCVFLWYLSCRNLTPILFFFFSPCPLSAAGFYLEETSRWPPSLFLAQSPSYPVLRPNGGGAINHGKRSRQRSRQWER